MVCSFFLGANTPEGFYSLFDELSAFDLHVIKGSCGSGKSTLLKTIISKTAAEGMCERILCSGDPDSLDGVVFHRLNTAAVDGTAPHTAETVGLGRYILMPPAKDGIGTHREQITALKDAKKQSYRQVYACLRGAKYARDCARTLIDFGTERLCRRAYGILSREAKPKACQGRLHRRFIDAWTPDGMMTLWDTVDALASRVYAIEDRLSLAAPLLETLQKGLLERGYEVYSCLSPMEPAQVRHLIVPELKLAFVTSDRLSQYRGESYRRMHLTAYTDQNSLHGNKAKIRLFEKLQDELLGQACSELGRAKQAHKALEGLCLPYLDIPALKKLNGEVSL